MAASRIIEEESGTYTGRIRHAHNGYYAGDFSAQPPTMFGPTPTGRVALALDPTSHP